ncbi:MAG: hypothetical protein AB7D00_00475 [Rhodospirillaceae bacterium]
MTAVIGWLISIVSGWIGGDAAKATKIVGWAGFAVAVIAAAILSGVLVHTYDTAIHEAEIAVRDAAAAKTLSAKTAETLEAERRAHEASAARDEAYAHLDRAREEARLESARLSDDLRRALERLRQHAAAGNGGAAVSGGGTGSAVCADLRTALDRTARALELYQTEGDQAVADGQRGVNVATDAALAARTRTAKPAGDGGHE